MKILTVIGARPQFIKAAMISRALQELRPQAREVLIHTGQHYDNNMSAVFFEELDIPKPTFHLGINCRGHGAMTGAMLKALEPLLVTERPDWVLVYGDTNSTLAGALAAAKLHIPVAHIEGGLRSFNRRMPEEINRVLTDHVAEVLFAPTKAAVENLQREGVSEECIHHVGDVMYDAILFYREHSYSPAWFKQIDFSEGNYVLATIHRAENTDDSTRLGGIIKGLGQADCPVLLPLHPRTRQRLKEMNFSVTGNIHIVDPVGYLEMLWLEENCAAIATDSGGVQKEAYFLQKPCILLRDETEWVELVEVGAAMLAGTDANRIANEIKNRHRFSIIGNDGIFGSGDAADKIVQILGKYAHGG